MTPIRTLLALSSLVALTAFASVAAAQADALREKQDKQEKREEPPAPKLDVLRFSGIPDADKKDLSKQYEVVSAYLAKELGIKVEFVNVPDYAGAVTALCANKIDFAWLGGVTAVQAEERSAGKVAFIAARDTDLKFKSYFIANKRVVESGALKALDTYDYGTVEGLKSFAMAFQPLSFTFGDKLSTSGHFMPRHFLTEAGLDPEAAFKGKPGYQLQGGHSATLKAVAGGIYDLGVLNYASWEKADAQTKANAPVVAVSPAYVDYCWVAHQRIGKESIAKLRAAFVKLDAKTKEHKPVLEVFSAASFVPADPKMWDGMRAVMQAVRERGIVQ